MCPRPRPAAALRVVCAPYAGGGVSAYWDWADLLGEDVELWCAVLPGRERRFAEPAVTDLALIAEPLAEAIRENVRAPYALFGHSMGALIAFEVARGLDPAHVFVSAAKAPHLGFGEEPHLLDDEGLLDWMTRLGGVPADLLAHPDMLALLLPTLRADLAVCAGYHGERAGSTIDVPITAFAGTGDPLATVADVAAWQHHTTAGFDLVVRPGGHFYLKDDPETVLGAVVRAMAVSTTGEGVQ